MKLGILFMFLLYYGLLSMFFLMGGSDLMEGYNSTIEMNVTEVPEGGFSLITILDEPLKFILFVGFGIGLPDDTPTWFNIIFIIWQSIILLLFIGFIYQAIRGS